MGGSAMGRSSIAERDVDATARPGRARHRARWRDAGSARRERGPLGIVSLEPDQVMQLTVYGRADDGSIAELAAILDAVFLLRPTRLVVDLSSSVDVGPTAVSTIRRRGCELQSLVVRTPVPSPRLDSLRPWVHLLRQGLTGSVS
jgi:hypothetical protein